MSAQQGPTPKHWDKPRQKVKVSGMCQKLGAIRLYLHKLVEACAKPIAAVMVGMKERTFFLTFIPTLFPKTLLLYQLYSLSFADPSEIKRMERGWMKRGQGEDAKEGVKSCDSSF